jgi:hypothetical protein
MKMKTGGCSEPQTGETETVTCEDDGVVCDSQNGMMQKISINFFLPAETRDGSQNLCRRRGLYNLFPFFE